jgi:lipopolysaccharide export system protein LptA
LRRILTVLALVVPAANLAGEAVATPPPVKEIPAFGLLPDGSELKNVILPRYDENRRLNSVMSAKAMTIVSAGEIAGDTVSVLFYNSDQTQRGRVDFVKAVFNQQKGLLTTKEPVHLQSDRMSTRGGGLYYSIAESKGFMLGPVTTHLQAPPTETTMHAPKSPLRATAVLGVSLLTQSLIAAPPKTLTAAETAAIQADAASKAAAATAAQVTARHSLDNDVAAASTVSKDAATFVTQADLPAVSTDTVPAPAKPLAIQSGPNDTLIHCEGGMYFDADEGVMVYLKNVTVKDPRFNLSGANELKIFFEKKPAKVEKEGSQEPQDKAKPGAKGSPGAGFGEVERIVATGAVRIEQKAEPGKDPIHASGAIFSYNVKADQIILSGGYPWYTQGTTFMRAKEPNLTIRMSPKTGSFVTEGIWEMGGNLESKKEKTN